MSPSGRRFSRASRPLHKQRLIKRCNLASTSWDFSATASTTPPRFMPRTWAYQSTRRSMSRRSPPTSSCWKKSLLVLEAWRVVLEGEKVFSNIVKYVRMGASSNFGNMFSVLGASALLPFVPMAPIQVLTNNLLYDFSQVPIPTDNVAG